VSLLWVTNIVPMVRMLSADDHAVPRSTRPHPEPFDAGGAGQRVRLRRRIVNEVWDLWYPQGGATGLSFARSLVDGLVAGNRVLVHAAPPRLDVAVRLAESGHVIDEGYGLERSEPGPISYLDREGGFVTLQDGWPTDDDLGKLVILPGGEAGILRAWWHADDHSEWRWQVEFSNHV
jgi:hypothetical protein